MKPLVILILTFGFALIVLRLVGGFEYALSGRIAMSVMLLFTSLGHFLYPKGMAMMIPASLPFREGAIYVTGLIEIGAAVGLLIPWSRVMTGWLLIIFFILMLPANIYAAVKRVNLQKATYDGSGPGYLWFRVPLQILFIVWTYYFAIAKDLPF
jgi:uncharacterized membrane protein